MIIELPFNCTMTENQHFSTNIGRVNLEFEITDNVTPRFLHAEVFFHIYTENLYFLSSRDNQSFRKNDLKPVLRISRHRLDRALRRAACSLLVVRLSGKYILDGSQLLNIISAHLRKRETQRREKERERENNTQDGWRRTRIRHR